MSITDELRKWAGCNISYKTRFDELIAIADRIDEEDAMKYAAGIDEGFASADDWLNANEDDLAKHGWVKLPVDAEGKPWHVGDMTENKQTVQGMCLNKHGWHFLGTVNDIDPSIHTHYQPPTVEDVLREFAQEMNDNLGMYTGEAIDADEWRDADAKTIADFAAKLRLAGDAE